MPTYAPIFVPGHPKPKGSWVPVRTRSGEIKFRPASKRTAEWCKHLKAFLSERWANPPIEEGPIRLELYYLLPRPKTVVRAKPTVKGTGDIDKLERAILDALTGVAYKDDAQVCRVTHEKDYTEGEPGVWITLSSDF